MSVKLNQLNLSKVEWNPLTLLNWNKKGKEVKEFIAIEWPVLNWICYFLRSMVSLSSAIPSVVREDTFQDILQITTESEYYPFCTGCGSLQVPQSKIPTDLETILLVLVSKRGRIKPWLTVSAQSLFETGNL